MSYFFHPEAETEHFETVGYYESCQHGLGGAYLDEFEAQLKIVSASPSRYRVERKPNIRCVRLKRFPFKVIFRDVDGILQILAVSHKRRRPDYWLNRL